MSWYWRPASVRADVTASRAMSAAIEQDLTLLYSGMLYPSRGWEWGFLHNQTMTIPPYSNHYHACLPHPSSATPIHTCLQPHPPTPTARPTYRDSPTSLSAVSQTCSPTDNKTQNDTLPHILCKCALLQIRAQQRCSWLPYSSGPPSSTSYTQHVQDTCRTPTLSFPLHRQTPSCRLCQG